MFGSDLNLVVTVWSLLWSHGLLRPEGLSENSSPLWGWNSDISQNGITYTITFWPLSCSTGLLLDFTETNSAHVQPSPGPRTYDVSPDSQTLPHSLQCRIPFSLPALKFPVISAVQKLDVGLFGSARLDTMLAFIFPSLCQERISSRRPGWLITSQLWSQSTTACCFMSKNSCFAYFVQFYSYSYWESSSYLIMAGSKSL